MLPRSIATRDAFENAMALDIAMGGSTNTILHLLAAAHEAGVDFGLKEIDELSRRVPCLCKVAPNGSYHVEDVHRAGGIYTILGELDRAGLLNRAVHTVHGAPLVGLGPAVRVGASARRSSCTTPRPAGCGRPRRTRSRPAGSRSTSTPPPGASATSRTRTPPTAGSAMLYGNLAPDGAVVKTAGVPEELWTFSGPARVFESQEDAVDGILGRAGDRRRRRGDQVRGAARRARHAGDAVPDVVPEGEGPRPGLRADHRRAVLRRDFRAVDRAHLPRGGQRRRHRARARRTTRS